MIAAIQARMARIDAASMPTAPSKTDAAALQARRVPARLIEAERAAWGFALQIWQGRPDGS